MTTDKDGNIVRKYRDGRTTVHTPAQVKRSFWRTIIILILMKQQDNIPLTRPISIR